MSSTDSADLITGDCLVCQVVERHPQTILVFAQHGLQCVGCYIAPFHTIADSAREHESALGPLLEDLNRAIGHAQSTAE